MRPLVIAAAALLSACVPTHHHERPDSGAHTEAPATRISGEWVEATDAAHKASISFDGDRASGSTACNRWNASVDQSNGFRFGMAAVTEMYCAEAMDAEQRFLRVLQDTRSAEEDGGMLTLKDANGWELMRFVRPAGTLTGVTWRRVDDEDANPHGGTLTIDETGRASGSTGCNRWFAQTTREDDRLTFGQIGMTRMACPEPQMAAEQHFEAALDAARRYRVEGEDLILTDDAGREVARFMRER